MAATGNTEENEQDFESYWTPSAEDRTMRLFGRNPYLLFGIGGGIGGLGWMAWNYKTRGSTKTSVYLIHTRLLVQATVIGAMSVGMFYSLWRKTSEYYQDCYQNARRREAAQQDGTHKINWPRGAMESKPGRGIIVTEFKRQADPVE